MEKVLYSEYIKAKDSGEMTSEVMDIITRASRAGVIRDDLGETAESGLEQTQSTEETVDEISLEENDAEILGTLLGDENIDSSVQQTNVLLEAEKAKNTQLLQELSELKASRDAQDRLAEQYGSTQTGDGSNVLDMINEVKEEDYDSGYDYMKAQFEIFKKIIPEIANTNSDNPQMRKVFDIVEGMDREKKEEENNRLLEERNQLVAEEVESFWKETPEFKGGESYTEAEKDYQNFVQEVTNGFGYDTNKLQLFLVKLANPSTRGELVKALTSKNITMPDNFDAMYNTLALMDFRDGVRINEKTGEAEAIKNAYGQKQVLPDLGLAYMALNKNTIRAEERKNALKQVSERSQQLDRGATVIPSERLDTIQPDDIMNEQEMASILADIRANPQKYMSDPEAMARYQQVKEKLNGM